MKRSRLILSILCASSITGFLMASTCVEQQFSGKNAPLQSPFLLSHLTPDKLDKTDPQVPSPAYAITLNTVLPINDFDGIDLVKISGDLLSVISPVTESGASTNPAIAGEADASTAMEDYGKRNVDRTHKNLSHIIPVRQVTSPSAFVIRVVK